MQLCRYLELSLILVLAKCGHTTWQPDTDMSLLSVSVRIFSYRISWRQIYIVIWALVLIAFTCCKLYLGLSSEDAVCKGVAIDGLTDLLCCGPVDGIQERDQFPHTRA